MSHFCCHLVAAHSDRHRLDVTSHSSHSATGNRLHWSLDKRVCRPLTIYDQKGSGGQETNNGVQPMDIEQLSTTRQPQRMSLSCSATNANDPTRSRDRKPTTSENPLTVKQKSRHHQRHVSEIHEIGSHGARTQNRMNALEKRRLVRYMCGGKGHPARLRSSADDWKDVGEVGTGKSSDADSGLDWGHWTDVRINSVVSQKDQAQRG